MAVCEIWDVKGRLDHPIDYAENPEKTANPKYTEADLQALVDVMEYATNKDKTEKRFFVTGVNCDTATARDEMMIAKAEWNDESEIVCYHGFQSFKHGEVTPEVAHEVGVKLAEKMWGDRFQVIVATHLNTECLHNHFVVNSVSFLDGKHYHDNKANLRLLRQRSDELCREYALSVIEHPGQSGKHYGEWKAEQEGRPTQRGDIRLDLDAAIEKLGSKPIDQSRRPTVRGDIRLDFDAAAMQSDTVQDLIRQMEEMGYTWNFSGKYPKIKPPGKDRYFRLYKLGAGYDSLETLAKRVLHMQEETSGKRRMPSTYYRYHGSFRKRKKATGFLALYYYHCYRIGVFAKRTYPKYTPEFREAQKQLHEMSKAAAFLHGADIHSKEQFQSYREKLNQEIQLCDTQIKELQQQLAASNDPAENEALVHQLDRLHQQQQNFAEQKRLCKIVAQQQVQEEAPPQPQETEPTAPKKQSGAIGVE